MKPTDERLEQIKAEFPDRSLVEVEAVDGEDHVMTFVMTGPTREEYKFFVNKMIAAREVKDEADRLWAIRLAVENAATAMIRWPDRDEVKKAFGRHPEMIDGFAAEIQKAAGSNIELRSRKL